MLHYIHHYNKTHSKSTQHVGTLYSTGQENVIGAGVKALGEEADVQMTEAARKNVQYFVGTNALHYRRPFMEIENPLEDGLGIVTPPSLQLIYSQYH